MGANTLGAIRDRVTSLCQSAPFSFGQSQSPFSFDLQPTGVIDQVFRLEAEGGGVIGGMSYAEDRSDVLRIWVARKQSAAPESMYRTLVTDATSLTAAITRDGAELGGDYDVPDEARGLTIQQDAGREFAVLRLSLGVNYEAQL